MNLVENIQYGVLGDPRQTLDLYLPDGENFATFVYFHGGGIEGGSKEEQAEIFKNLANRGVAVASVEYRMYPYAKFPDFLEDCAAACAWVKKHIKEYDGADNIFVGGSSAGGYITMMLYFDRKYFAPHHLTPCDFSGFLFDAGQPTTHFNVLRQRGVDSRRVLVDDGAPLYHIKDYESEPKVLILVSDHDMTNRYEQTRLLCSTMKHFGYPEASIGYRLMKNTTHCSYINEPVFADIIYDFVTEDN